jgi:cytochrome bd-type quinol oxidase subunit 1
MIIFGVVLGLAIMAAMVYLALNKKSGFAVRLAALIALALMIITVIVCLFIVFGGRTALVEESVLAIEDAVPVEAEQGNNSLTLLLVFMFLFVFFAIVVLLSLREHRKNLQKQM